jgi:hypothetical protein
MSNAGGSTGATGHSISTTYINGDEAEYTGKSSIIHGKKFHEVRFLEGHKSGQTVVTMRAPDGSGLPACAPTSSGIVTPHVPALRTMASNADQAARDAARVCTTPPASQAPEQTGAVPNSETPQDQTPGFERVKPFNCDPSAMLAKGIKPEQLVGMGVNYTGNMASPDGDVAGTQGERSANDSTPGDAFDAQAAFEKYGGKGNIDESTDITAKSKAFSDMAESEGYKVAGRGDKYVTITKSFGKNAGGYDIESIINVRISDYSNVNRGRHFGEHDINIAPDDGYDRDTFVSALKKIKSAYVNDDLSTIIPDEPTPPASHAPENTTGEHHENAK